MREDSASAARQRAREARLRAFRERTDAVQATQRTEAQDPFQHLVSTVSDRSPAPLSLTRLVVATLFAMLSLAVRKGLMAPSARNSALAQLAQVPMLDLRGGETQPKESRQIFGGSPAARARRRAARMPASSVESAMAAGSTPGTSDVRGGVMEEKPAVRRSRHRGLAGLSATNGRSTAPPQQKQVTPRDDEDYDEAPPMELPRAAFIPDVFPNNEAWRQEKLLTRDDYFMRFRGYHKPQYLWIGCSDARVPADVIMGEDTGQVFVHRNIANQVIGTDSNIMSVMQYAVDYLKVKHIIVCGHYDCGGVRAACAQVDHGPPLQQWLRNIRDVRRIYRDELEAIEDDEERHRKLVELNTVEQCLSVLKTGIVQKRRVKTGRNRLCPYPMPRVHAVVYDPTTGKLTRVNVEHPEKLEDITTIYDLGAKNEVLTPEEFVMELQ